MIGAVLSPDALAALPSSPRIGDLIGRCGRGELALCVPAAALLSIALDRGDIAAHVLRMSYEIPAGSLFIAPLGENTPAVADHMRNTVMPYDAGHASYEASAHRWPLIASEHEAPWFTALGHRVFTIERRGGGS